MSCSYYSSNEAEGRQVKHGRHRSCRGHWSGMNIAAMVLGFIIFPPLGLVVLFWTLSGRPIQALPGWISDKFHQFKGSNSSMKHSDSDNVVFNEYQQTQYDRINEIKEEIRNRAANFELFRADSKRRKDQKEFDKFMASKPVNHDEE